jgi:hypothetical protein
VSPVFCFFYKLGQVEQSESPQKLQQAFGRPAVA